MELALLLSCVCPLKDRTQLWSLQMGLLWLSCLPALSQVSVLLSGLSPLRVFQAWCVCSPAWRAAANQLQEEDAHWNLAPSYLCYQIRADSLGHRLLLLLQGGISCFFHQDHFLCAQALCSLHTQRMLMGSASVFQPPTGVSFSFSWFTLCLMSELMEYRFLSKERSQ